jgi:hypothetical protein
VALLLHGLPPESCIELPMATAADPYCRQASQVQGAPASHKPPLSICLHLPVEHLNSLPVEHCSQPSYRPCYCPYSGSYTGPTGQLWAAYTSGR